MTDGAISAAPPIQQSELSKELNRNTWKHLYAIGGENRPATLYHYTSVSAALGIISSQSFWASNIHSINDVKEKRLGLSLLDEAVAQFPWQDGFFDFIKRAAARYGSGKYITVTVSLSAEPDLLSLWRAYSYNPEDPGLCLGLEANRFSHNDHFRFATPVYLLGLFRVLYDGKAQQNFIQEFLRTYDQVVRQLDKDEPSRKEWNRHFYAWMLIDSINYFAGILKDACFREEHEWRLLMQFPILGPHILFRQRHRAIVPYVTVGAPAGQTLPIVEVKLGPVLKRESDFRPAIDLLLATRAHDTSKIAFTETQTTLRAN